MKNHKWQHIRIRINSAGAAIKFSVDTDKNFKRVKGIRMIYPQDVAATGSTLGLTCNNQEVFANDHEVRMITCGQNVAPNKRFFLFEEVVEANGTVVSGLYTDGQINPYLTTNGQAITGVLGVSDFMPTVANPNVPVNPAGVVYPYDLQVQLWLTNDELKPLV